MTAMTDSASPLAGLIQASKPRPQFAAPAPSQALAPPAAPPAPKPAFKRPVNGSDFKFGSKANTYSGKCIACGQFVEAREGVLGKVNGRWVVGHRGECPLPLAEPEAIPALAVWPGIYTIETEDGHRTFKVSRQDSDAAFAPGELILGFLSGPNNQSDYTSCAFIKGDASQPRAAIWKKHRDNAELIADIDQFLADPDAALTAKHCARCGELLSVPASVAAGFGPVCITKGLS
jgi:hypothetical protein